MIYAQITNSIIINTIILADGEDQTPFSAGYDYFIEIDALSPQPGVGWCYDGTNFTPYISYPIVGGLPAGIPSGSNTTFAPFNLSSGSQGFLITVNGSVVSIGCKNFDYVWLRYSFWMMLTQGASSVNIFTLTDTSLLFNNQFSILLADMQLIWSALQTLL